MNVHMNEQMFQVVTDSSMRWGENWRAHDGRFENYSAKSSSEPPSYSWKMAYWFGTSGADMILGRSWIIEQGYEFELLWDLAEWDNGESLGWLIVTDYMTSSWQEREE